MQEKCRFAGKGGRGVIPLPPPFSFFLEGVTPPTHVSGRVGGTPSLVTDPLVFRKKKEN
jgi:hypothetical protein